VSGYFGDLELIRWESEWDAELETVRVEAHAAGVAEGRRQAAADIRAGMLSGIRLPPGLPGYRYDGTRPPVSVYAEWAAQIAAGE